METEKKMRLHPLMAGAAGGVIIASALAIAAIGGYLPGSNAKNAETQQVAAAQQPAKPAHKPCSDCGVIVEVKVVDVPGKGTGIGAAAGGVAGAVIGHEIGENRAGTAIGAVVGGVAGHQIERQARMYKRYEASVRMHDGTVKHITSDEPQTWKSGDRVRVREGRLTLISARN